MQMLTGKPCNPRQVRLRYKYSKAVDLQTLSTPSQATRVPLEFGPEGVSGAHPAHEKLLGLKRCRRLPFSFHRGADARNKGSAQTDCFSDPRGGGYSEHGTSLEASTGLIDLPRDV